MAVGARRWHSALVALWLLRLAAGSPQRSPPHVLFVVIDDLGFTDVGFRSHEIRTPTIDSLARDGVVLDQYYVHAVCSPSRATFMTGRYAMHHGIVDWIPPASTYGLPLNETTMADKFREVGYATHAVGKWHLGFYRKEMTPTFRGFDSFFGFYSGGESYFQHSNGGHYDFRRDPSPRCGPGCSQVAAEANGLYSTTLFSEEAVRIVREHPEGRPLFLYLAYQAVHAPAEVPREYADAYKDTISDPVRRTFAGMLSCVDEGLANVTAALRARGMMDTTLVVFTTDNGGPTDTNDGVGARNWPLRGGKHSVWEGGTRGTAFLSGKMLKRTGYTFTHLMHGADWLPTLATVAGFDAATIPLPLDGVDQWAAINGGNDHDRQRLGFVYGNSTDYCSWSLARREMSASTPGAVPCGFAIREQQWKLVLGYGGGPDTWCNRSSRGPICKDFEAPSPPAGLLEGAAAGAGATSPPIPACVKTGFCLWDVVADPYEHAEVSAEHPEVVELLKTKMADTLRGYRSYRLDKSCGKPRFEFNKSVGWAWAPWCHEGAEEIHV